MRMAPAPTAVRARNANARRVALVPETTSLWRRGWRFRQCRQHFFPRFRPSSRPFPRSSRNLNPPHHTSSHGG
jgi:hypothetical protein